MNERPVVIGVDPGGRWTGLVVRSGDELLAHQVVTNQGAPAVEHGYLRQVLAQIWAMWSSFDPSILGVEDVIPPNGHLGMMRPADLIGPSKVLGAIQERYLADRVVVVRPARHGSFPLATYPPELVGVREKSGGGVLRHCRSAWDIAGAAVVQARWAGVP